MGKNINHYLNQDIKNNVIDIAKQIEEENCKQSLMKNMVLCQKQ